MADIDVARDGAILALTFNRPDKKNAITEAMYLALAGALRDAERDTQVRVILIQGQPDIFTAGNDLEDFLKHPPTHDDAPVLQFLRQISQTDKPIVAAVAGAAAGVGTTLLLHCDVVYAADSARFSLPFTSLGLCPEAASSLLLPQLAGHQRAAEKLLFGEPFDAVEAQAMGLVNRIVPADELVGYARERAARLAMLPAASLRATKRLMKAAQQHAVQQTLRDESVEFGRRLVSPEAREAFNAFLEKRKPDFSRFS